MQYVVIILAAEFIRLLIVNYIVAYLIMVIHELAHYSAARYYKMDIDQINIGTEKGTRYCNIGLHICGNINVSYEVTTLAGIIRWYRQITIICIIPPLITIVIIAGVVLSNVYYLPLLAFGIWILRDFKLAAIYWRRYKRIRTWYEKRNQRVSRNVQTI